MSENETKKNENKNETKQEGLFKRGFRKLGEGWRAVREHPVTHAVFALLGGGLALGVGAALRNRNSGPLEIEDGSEEYDDEPEEEEDE